MLKLTPDEWVNQVLICQSIMEQIIWLLNLMISNNWDRKSPTWPKYAPTFQNKVLELISHTEKLGENLFCFLRTLNGMMIDLYIWYILRRTDPNPEPPKQITKITKYQQPGQRPILWYSHHKKITQKMDQSENYCTSILQIICWKYNLSIIDQNRRGR